MKTLVILYLATIIPNCLPINETRHLDKTEVTAKDYFWFVLDSSTEDKNALYPSQVFEETYGTSFQELRPDNMVMNYPIIGLSKEQCLAYCKWRTEKVQAKYLNTKIVFELPSESDYSMAFKTDYNSKSKKSNIYGYKSRYISRNSKKFKGLNDNVSELLADGSIYQGKDQVVGFRCVAVVK